MIDITVTDHGPILDGRAHEIVDRFAAAAGEAVAEEGQRLIREHVGQQARHPTGTYASRTLVERTGSLHRVYNRLPYARWLEGTSRRNATTGFAGYALFAEARRELEQRAGEIAESVLPPYLAELGGGR